MGIEEPARERLPRLARVVFGVVLLPVIEAVVEGTAVEIAGFTEATREAVLGTEVTNAPSRQSAEPVAFG
ncbi:MAG: hypothetical protein C3F10_11905 [Dehalococcoidia bacterium]|nr:MAG: hypothetical protein C3F10_11905 [Dehalococcoidia bacterium]